MTPLRPLRWLLLLVLLLPLAVHAADPAPDRFEGTWRTAHDLDAVKRGIAQAIERTLNQMAFYKRPFARPKLLKVTEPCREVRIYEDRGRLGIACDEQVPALSVPDGRPVTYTNRQGDTFRLHQRVHGERIVQIWQDDAGQRRNVYTIGPDGALRIGISVYSDQLPVPVEYTHAFTRAEGAQARMR